MRHYGLIGKRLGHSFSAKFFTAKFQAEQIDADYRLFEIDDLAELPELIKREELSGFNVTIPYKEQIIDYLDELTAKAREVGAVNCVSVVDGRTIGDNTDTTGIEASLEWLDVDADTKALILGSGGASKAVQYVLRKYSIEYRVVSRDASRGDMTYDMLTPEIMAEHRLIINTTPVGMSPDTTDAPAIPYDMLSGKHRLFDLVYNPATTEFVSRGKERNAQTIGGMLMLQTQAIASWHIWEKLM